MPRVQKVVQKRKKKGKNSSKSDESREIVTYSITIPKNIVESLEIEKGDEIEFTITNGTIKNGKIVDPKVELTIKHTKKED